MGGLKRGITAEQVAALRSVAPVLPADVYLAGGVAIALTLRHRVSHDLDLFVPRDFDPDRLVERLAASGSALKVTSTSPGTLYLEISEVPASILAYRYPLLSPPSHDARVPIAIASPDDLACMKLSAIASRGMARDFWDLHALLEHGVAGNDLPTALAAFQRKYVADDIGHVIRSLVYFGDADAEPPPRGLRAATWEHIKRDFERRVRALD